MKRALIGFALIGASAFITVKVLAECGSYFQPEKEDTFSGPAICGLYGPTTKTAHWRLLYTNGHETHDVQVTEDAACFPNALWELRKLKAAEEQYRRLIELWPNASLPYWCYGDFLACERNDSSTAERYLRKAFEIEPKNQWANYFLGKHLLYWDREDEAKRFLTNAARLGHARARELLQQLKTQQAADRFNMIPINYGMMG